MAGEDVKEKSSTVSFEAWSWRQGCGKSSCSENGQKFLKGGRELLRFLKAVVQIKQSFVEMFKTHSSWDEDELQHPGQDGRSKEEHWGTSIDAEVEAVPELMRWTSSVKWLCFLPKKCSEIIPKWNLGSVC